MVKALTPDEIKKIKRLSKLYQKLEDDDNEGKSLTPEEYLEYIFLKDFLTSVLPIDC